MEHVVPDFLLKIYLTEMSVTDEIKRDHFMAQEKNKIYIPFKDRSCLLECSHSSYKGNLRTAKLFFYFTTFLLDRSFQG